MQKLAMIFVLAIVSTAHAQSSDWVVTKSWSQAYEDKFSEFINVMGESGCNSIDTCLKSSTANPFYVNRTPKDVTYYSDCADLPFELRAFFAWMEGLPFDYVDDVSPVGGGDDVRYSKDGNIPNSFAKIVAGHTYNGPKELTKISGIISTAMYRMHYKYVSDFYPAGINTKDIRPGTVMYDPSGHAAIIYKIETKDGTVRMMDAHPDGSMTHIRFDQKFVRSRVSHGAGFKNWRPELNYAPTETLPDFSLERFQADYTFNGVKMNYYDYVKTVMSGGNLKINPIDEVADMIDELCANTQDRMLAVAEGIKSGIETQDHPDKLPMNIYGTEGDWESYSTPSRDARVKTGFVTLLTETQRYVTMYKSGDTRIDYPAGNLKGLAKDLLATYKKAIQAPNCHFQYTKSDGSVQSLGYEDVIQRLFKLSFDPYNCVELRWGAAGSELASCQDSKNKMDWYRAEQGLRNQIERKYDDVMDFDLANTEKKLGVKVAPDVDLESYLNGLVP